jgi:hypothetical protein
VEGYVRRLSEGGAVKPSHRQHPQARLEKASRRDEGRTFGYDPSVAALEDVGTFDDRTAALDVGFLGAVGYDGL